MNGAQPHPGYIDSLGPPPAAPALQPHQPHLNGFDTFKDLAVPNGDANQVGANGFAFSDVPLANGGPKARAPSPFMVNAGQISSPPAGGIKSPLVLSPRNSVGGPMFINERGASLGLGRRRSNIGDQAKDAFWKANLAGKPPLLLLPVDKPRTAASSLADALQVGQFQT